MNDSSNSDAQELSNKDEPLIILPQMTMADTLARISKVININSISKFNISRGHVWEGTVRGLTRKSFSPENKISVKFCDDIGISEGAVDLGSSKREFFTLVLDWLRNSQLFCGSDNCKYLSCNASCQTKDDYFYAGQMIAMSLVHGGTRFCLFFSCINSCSLITVLDLAGVFKVIRSLDNVESLV